jgi:hypothetical protein
MDATKGKGFLGFILPKILSKRKIKKIYLDEAEKELLFYRDNGYLVETGWFKSFETRNPIDLSGKPLPWVTYSFIDFISGRINKTMNLFEYGSGYSTLFYSSFVNKVISVEHELEWYNKIKETMPKNVTLILKELKYGGEYSQACKGEKFDIIIVDGRDRVNCCIQSINSIKENGVIVLDDSERAEYKEGRDFLVNKGYKYLDFSGISPGLFYKKSTSVFYKSENVLSI